MEVHANVVIHLISVLNCLEKITPVSTLEVLLNLSSSLSEQVTSSSSSTSWIKTATFKKEIHLVNIPGDKSDSKNEEFAIVIFLEPVSVLELLETEQPGFIS